MECRATELELKIQLFQTHSFFLRPSITSTSYLQRAWLTILARKASICLLLPLWYAGRTLIGSAGSHVQPWPNPRCQAVRWKGGPDLCLWAVSGVSKGSLVSNLTWATKNGNRQNPKGKEGWQSLLTGNISILTDINYLFSVPLCVSTFSTLLSGKS